MSRHESLGEPQEVGFVDWALSHHSKLLPAALIGWGAFQMLTGVVDSTLDPSAEPPALIEHSFDEIMSGDHGHTPFEEGMLILGVVGVGYVSYKGFKLSDRLYRRPRNR